jgi:hypothetical protein
MSEAEPTPKAKPRRQGLWLTVSEIVGVLALILAGLNYWDNHQQRVHDAKLAAAQSQAAQTPEAFVATGASDDGGKTVTLRPLSQAQAIQSQRYRFPGQLLDHAVELSAERPRLETDWIAEGLKRALDEQHAPASGEWRAPVIIETTYVEDGETRTDVSLYDVGFAWKHELLGGRKVRLQGVALVRRNVRNADPDLLEARWTKLKADMFAKPIVRQRPGAPSERIG